MFKFKYRYCKAHMAKYISGDLSDVARRRIGRFINESEDCHKEYLRQRAIAEELQSSLPSLGRPDASRLDHIWLSLQTELAPATAGASISPGLRSPGSQSLSYTVLMLLLGVALLLPVAIGLNASLGGVELPQRQHIAEIARRPGLRALPQTERAIATPSRLTLPRRPLALTSSPRFVR